MIAFTPIDIGPVRRPDEIYRYFNERKSTANGLLWHYYLLKDNTAGLLPGRAKYMRGLEWVWDREFKARFPEFIALVESLPFSEITFVNLIENRTPVPSHQDLVEEAWNARSVRQFIETHRDLEPCIYRILIRGPRENPRFYLARKEKEADERQRFYVRLPEETSTFAMNGTQLFHGAEKLESEKLLCFISGFLDRERHLALVERSLTRYQDYAIRLE